MAGLDDKYVSVLFVFDLPALTANTYSLLAELRSHGATAAAATIERALVKLMQSLEEIGVAMAKFAQVAVRDEEENSRVRPNSDEPNGMGTWLECDPLPEIPGSIGVVNKEAIDQPGAAPWWWTNEIGYSGHVGRELHGFYFDSGWENASAPSADARREHPLFAPTPEEIDGRPMPQMTIKEPIPERRFVQKALNRIEGEWQASVRRALDIYLTTVADAMATARAQLTQAQVAEMGWF